MTVNSKSCAWTRLRTWSRINSHFMHLLRPIIIGIRGRYHHFLPWFRRDASMVSILLPIPFALMFECPVYETINTRTPFDTSLQTPHNLYSLESASLSWRSPLWRGFRSLYPPRWFQASKTFIQAERGWFRKLRILCPQSLHNMHGPILGLLLL